MAQEASPGLAHQFARASARLAEVDTANALVSLTIIQALIENKVVSQEHMIKCLEQCVSSLGSRHPESEELLSAFIEAIRLQIPRRTETPTLRVVPGGKKETFSSL